MGWLRAMFSGNSPDATREIMKLAIRQNLKRVVNRPPIQARLDAGAHALCNRYLARGYDKPLELVATEILPFAFLSAADFEAALAEYAVAGEHPGDGALEWLIPIFRGGLQDCMAYGDSDYAPLKLRLYKLLTDRPDLLPWAAMLDDESLGHIWSGAKAAMEQLGLDTSDMIEEPET
jgi:hypothetical protein